MLFLEDLSPGMKFESATEAITAERIKSFAAEFDPQIFHLDEERAKDTFFGGLAASGWHTAAFSMRLLVASAPIAGGIVGAGGQLDWLKPVRPGDMLRVVSEVVEVTPSRSRPERGTIILRAETRNQNDEIVQVFTCKLVVPRRAV